MVIFGDPKPPQQRARDLARGSQGMTRATATAAATVVAVALAVGLVLEVDHYSLWTDEATTGLLMRSGIHELAWHLATTHGSESAQPLYYLVLWSWMRAVGDSEAALRLPSVLFSLAAVLALRDILRSLALSDTIAAVGSASFLALPVVIWYSLEARPYAFVMLCCGLHIREASRCVRASSVHVRRLALLTLVSALAFPVAGVAALLSFGMVVAGRRPKWAPPTRYWRSPTLWLSTGTLAVAALVVMWSLLRSGEAAVPRGRSGFDSLGYALYELILGRSVGFSVVELRRVGGIAGLTGLIASGGGHLLVSASLAIGLGFIVLAGICGLHPRHDTVALSITLPWLATALLFGLYAVATGFPLLGRHLLFALPALAIILVLGLSRSSRHTAFAAVLLVWIAGTVSFAGMAFDERYAKEDFRTVARVVSECQLRPEEIFYVAYPPGFEYYGVAGTRTSISQGLASLRSMVGKRAVLVVDTSRFDPQGTLDNEAQRTLGLYRLDVPSLTVLSTVPLDRCDVS